MIKTMKDFKIETNHIPCFAHCLHNTVTSGITSFGDCRLLKNKTEEICSTFKFSSLLQRALRDK